MWKTRLDETFRKWKPVALLLGLSHRIIIPGFSGMPLYEVALFFFRGISKGSLTSRASSISFNFFLALFPAILFFFTIIPYLPLHEFDQSLMSLLSDLLPEHVFKTMESTIRDILTRPRGGLLSVGFLMALYFSTAGISSIIEAFNMSVHANDSRSLVKQKLISIFLVLLVAILTIVAIALITGGTVVLDFMVEKHLIRDWIYYYLILLGKWVVCIALIYFAISSIYYFGPGKSTRYRFFSAGSTLATMLALATTLGFDYYVSNFSRYNALYGSIGTLIILLLWVYFNALILLIGFELNASIHQAQLDAEAREETQMSDDY